MATINPFSNDDVRGELWEQGYLAGFNAPDGSHFPGPFSEELLDVYGQGEQAGRDDRFAADLDGAWVQPDIDLGELPEHVGLHALGVAFEKLGLAVGGLIALVLTVVFIPTDMSLDGLEPDWAGPADENDDSFIAVCTRNDHGPIEAATADGYWLGVERTSFVDAARDMQQHIADSGLGSDDPSAKHAETLVARCSTADKTCGPVWARQ